MNRRDFLSRSTAAAAAGLLANTPRTASAASASGIKLGLDHFAVRGTDWKAGEFVDYAASLKLDTLFISELHIFENFEPDYLSDLKAKADAAGLAFYVGTGCICPTSTRWKDTYGTPEEHLKLTIRTAKALGSPVARCYLGGAADRASDGGIDRHIEEVVKVCKACQSFAETEEIKIAVENHAGDMQSHELKGLVEAAGTSYVGVNIDPGNAVWALEDPMRHLEVLGPHTICTSVRDSMVWEDENGAVVQWTAVGEGLLDFAAYAKRFAELAPGVPLQVETISGFAKPFPYLQNEFWAAYPNAKAEAFAGFVALSKRGKPIDTFKVPDGQDKKAATAAYQKAEFERSISWLRANT